MAVWQSCSGGKILPFAVRAGYETDGQPLYVAKAKTADGLITPGKAACHLPGAHIPWGGKENIMKNYEILVQPLDVIGYYEWQPFSGGNVSPKAMSTDKGNYVARCKHGGSLVPGKVYVPHGCAYYSYGGKELKSTDYELFCQVK